MREHPLDGWMLLVCNPVAGSRRGLERLARVRRALDRAGVRYVAEVTQSRGDATKLARSAVSGGCSAAIAIGGDGTLFEVVNGVIPPGEAEANRSEVAVGLIQSGRGSDFGRSVGIPSDVDAACERLLQGRTVRVDLGRVTYRSFKGEERTRYFANAAGLGFDGEVALRANAAPRVMGGTIPYLSSLFTTLWSYRNKRVHAHLDDADEWQARINSIIVANGQYFGGGMKIAPDAQLSDGQLEVIVLGDLGRIELVLNLPKVYDGSHLTHPKVSAYRARRISVESPDRLLLQADGEVLGTAPATFTVAPSALRMIV